MIETSEKGRIAAGVTFFHVLPSSRDTWSSPSSLPAHRTPRSTGDSANAKLVQEYSAPAVSFVIGPPDGPRFALSWRVRSGLIRSHVVPSSVVRKTWLPV